MKIQKCAIESPNNNTENSLHKTSTSPTFKAGGFSAALNTSGGIMQWIEDGGFLVSFLIQDGLGMTLPRCLAGFLRDKEVTGHYNKQEGFEVLGREGLTGPCMMAVAPVMFALAAKFGKTTSVDSKLIKRFGNSLKELVSKSDFNKALLKNKDQFKNEFYKKNITEILENTLGKENVKEDSVKYILEQIASYEKVPSDVAKKFRGKSKHKKRCIANIVEHINNIKYNTSSELEILDKLKVGSKELNNIKPFSTKNAIEAMVKYSDDAITLNKNLEKLDSEACENIKDASVAKRFLANISTMAATLGVLSVLPKLYIRNSISPGARTAMQLRAAQQEENEAPVAEKQENQTEGEISFKGKSGKPSYLSKLGKFLSKNTNEKYSSELEYNGHNFTNTLMAGLSLFGLLLPRGLRAFSRAQVDENGKKDMTEIYEILIRDVSSSLAVVFAVPMLTRAFVSSYENKSGFVLMHKDRNMSKTKKVLDLINPYSSSHVLTNAEISSLYNGVNSTEKMVNFCKFIDKNKGDLQKILSKSEHADEILKGLDVDLGNLSKLPKDEKNKKITEIFEKLNSGSNKEKINKSIEKLMKGCGDKKGNKIASFARGLNSMPGLIATFLISPVILGWFIPRLTYANTRRIHAKKESEKRNKINTAA